VRQQDTYRQTCGCS